MKHAALRTARALRRRRWRGGALCLAGALALLAASGSAASAQGGTTGMTGITNDDGLDPLLNPAPFNGHRAIREYLRGALPSTWWAGEPEFRLESFSVAVHIPDGWQGNPGAAMMSLCPPRESVLWQHLAKIELVPVYRSVRRAGTTCRR